MKTTGKLAIQANHYHSLFEKNPHPAYLFDLDGCFVYVNKSGQITLGKTEEELAGQHFMPFVHEKDRERSARNFQKATRGETITDEIAVLRSDTQVDLLMTQIPVFEENQVIAVFVLAQDRSDRKHLEQSLLDNEMKLHTLIDFMPDLVLFKDGEGRWQELNAFGKKLFELEQVDYKGKTDEDLMPLTPFFAETLHNCVQYDDLAFETKEVQRYVEIIPQRDGTEKVLDTIKVPMFYEDGERRGLLLMARDVTEMRAKTVALQENEERYRMLVESAPVGMMVYQEQKLSFTNQAGCKLLGAKHPEDIIGRSVYDFVTLDYKDTIIKQDDVVGTKEYYELRIIRLDGQEVLGHVVSIPTMFQGKPAKQLVILEITEQKLAERAFLESESKFRHITENMSDLVSIVNLEGKYEYTSPSFLTVLGYEPLDLTQQPIFDFLHPADLGHAREFWQRIQSTHQEGSLEARFRHRDGHYLLLEATCAPIENEQGLIEQAVISARDITQRKKTEAMIHRMAYHDALTGLQNRVLFVDDLNAALQQWVNESGNVVAMFLDLDGFKNINDSLGHSTGDLLLQAVSERLRAYLNKGEMIYRIGGDEFTILIPQVTADHFPLQVAQRILNAFKQPWTIGGRTLHITASIGIAVAPMHGTDAESLMRSADIAMYYAKEKGKNNFQMFNDQLKERMTQRVTLESALRHAVQNNEFTLHYQPIIQTGSGDVVGAEALVRWSRPQHGLVSPGEFIPVAEETGLIVPIGEWVLRTACLQAKAWEAQGLPKIRVSVNLSSRQFQEPLFLQKLQKIIQETGVSPHWLGLEITESLIMTNVEYAIKTMQALRAMDIMVSIDDFGTGYSSLGYLKQFSVDKLKIDQTFVRDLVTNPDDEKIINSIIMLAKNLGLSVVAEGVETANHLQALQEKGCDELQGYYFSQPLPVVEFEQKFLQKQV